MKRIPVKSRESKARRPNPGPTYRALLDVFPLRPIHSEHEYDAAAEVLDKLAVRSEGDLAPDEQDYFDTLTLLVEAYDNEHYADLQPGEPLDMLKYIMQESGTTQAELGRLLGNRALASLILNGHRQLSKTHIAKLAQHFRVSPALFLSTASAKVQ